MLASLGAVQSVLDGRVNVTGRLTGQTCRQPAWPEPLITARNCSLHADISTQLQCLAPLLDALPEPTALAADISAANASVDGTLRPALADLSTQLGSLAERLEPGVGAYVQALETAAGAQVLLFDSPGGIVTQANVRQLQWDWSPQRSAPAVHRAA